MTFLPVPASGSESDTNELRTSSNTFHDSPSPPFPNFPPLPPLPTRLTMQGKPNRTSLNPVIVMNTQSICATNRTQWTMLAWEDELGYAMSVRTRRCVNRVRKVQSCLVWSVVAKLSLFL